MPLHEDTLREQYTTLLTAFKAAFPSIAAPVSDWWLLWFDKYPYSDIRQAIQTLDKHPLKARFTRESTGKAISALLRDAALRRAIASAPVSGDVK